MVIILSCLCAILSILVILSLYVRLFVFIVILC